MSNTTLSVEIVPRKRVSYLQLSPSQIQTPIRVIGASDDVWHPLSVRRIGNRSHRCHRLMTLVIPRTIEA